MTREELEESLAKGMTREELDANLAKGITRAELDASLATAGPQKNWRGWKEGDAPPNFVATEEAPRVTWGEGIQSWGKMMDPGAGIKSLNLLTGAQTLEQQTPTARELDSMNALVAPTAASLATVPFTGVGQVGFLPAMAISAGVGTGARTAYNMAALDQPAGEALKNAATDPLGVGIDVLAGGLGGYTPFLKGATGATGNIANQIRKILPSNRNFKGVKLMRGDPEGDPGRLQVSDIIEGLTPEQAAGARVTEGGLPPLTATDGSTPAVNPTVLDTRRSAPPVGEIERATAARRGGMESAATDPRAQLVERREAAEAKRDAAVAALKNRQRQLQSAANTSFDDQIDLLNSGDDLLTTSGGRPVAELEEAVALAQQELDGVLSVDAYGNPVKLAADGGDVMVRALEAMRASAEQKATGGASGKKDFLSRAWSFVKGEEPIIGRLRAPNEAMRKLVKDLDKKLADPNLDPVKRQELQAQRDVAEAGRQNIHANETIRKRVAGEFNVKFGDALNKADPADLLDDMIDGKVAPSKMFRALDGDADAFAAMGDKSREAFRDLRIALDDFYETQVRAGVSQSVDPQVIQNLRGAPEYWADLDKRSARTGVEILPRNLTEEGAAELVEAGKGSHRKFAEVAERLGFRVDPDAAKAGKNKLITPILRKEDYVPHRRLPMSQQAEADKAAHLKALYPHKSPAEIDKMLNSGGNRPILKRERKGEDLTGINTDLVDVLERTILDEDIANAAAWGGMQSKGVQAALGDFSGNVEQLPEFAVKILETLPEGTAKDSMRMYFTRKQNLETNPSAALLRAAGRGVANSQLTYAGLTSASELHKSLSMQGGIGSYIKGRAYVNKLGHENVNRLWQRSGATQSPIYDAITGVTQAEIKKHAGGRFSPIEGMKNAENFLREQGSYGNLAFIDDVARRASKRLDSDKGFGGRILQEASEIFPTMSPEGAAERLAREYLRTGGNMSEDIFLEGITELTQGQFYTTALGFIGDGFKSAGGGILLQYRPFMIQASKMFNQRVAAPFLRGIKTGDAELMALGAGRFIKMMPTAAATAQASALMRSAIAGRHANRDPEARAADVERRMRDLWAGGTGGLWADAAVGGKELLVDHNPNRIVDMASSVPLASMAKSIVVDPLVELGNFFDPDKEVNSSRVLNSAGNLISMRYPWVNAVTAWKEEELKAEKARQKLLDRRR